MSCAYRSTALADSRAGMVLAEAVHDAKGNVLLGQGVVLTAPLLAALARHGIARLPIVQAAPAAPADPAAVQARLDRLFRNHARDAAADAATAILRRYVEDYRLVRGVAQ